MPIYHVNIKKVATIEGGIYIDASSEAEAVDAASLAISNIQFHHVPEVCVGENNVEVSYTVEEATAEHHTLFDVSSNDTEYPKPYKA